MGMAGSAFAVGVGYVSGWVRPDNQGIALGVYGLGTMGQSVAVFLGPVLASYLGWQSVFYIGSGTLLLWTLVFGLFARDAPRRKTSASISGMIGLLRREKLAWGLGAFYFLTFGGFVALSIYLPLLLQDQFKLTLADAGFRTAGFVVLATLLRPVGGWLADRIGGSRVLAGVFLGIIPFALLMSWPAIVPFTERKERSEEYTSELQSRFDLVCRLLLEKKKKCYKRQIKNKKKKITKNNTKSINSY